MTKKQRRFLATPRGLIVVARKARRIEREAKKRAEFNERSRTAYQWFVENRDRLADANVI